jgi:uncharacterized SAM-dependent methyltransferase
VTVAGRAFDFAAGEVLVTEYSHKYKPEAFRRLAQGAGFVLARTWTDPDGLFSVQLLEVPGARQDSSGGT